MAETNKKHNNSKALIILISVLILFGLFFSYASIAKKKSSSLTTLEQSTEIDKGEINPNLLISVKTQKIAPQTITNIISGSGLTQPIEQVKVSPKMSGKVIAIYFDEGDYVSQGQVIAQLEQDQTLVVSYENAKTNLSIAQTNLENIKISTQKDIEAARATVETIKTTLENAKKSLANVEETNKQTIRNVEENALNVANNAISTAVNAIVTATDLQYKYFLEGSEAGSRIIDQKARAILLVLGEPNAGKWISQFIIPLNGGLKGRIEDAKTSFSEEKIDKILIDIEPALQSVKDLLIEIRTDLEKEPRALASEKTTIDAMRSNIDLALNNISSSIQSIANAKLAAVTAKDAAQSQIKSAEKQLASAEATLESVKSKAEAQIASAEGQITIAKGQINSIEAQLGNTTIFSPASGIINRWLVSEGEMAFAGNPMAEIVNTQIIKIELGLAPSDVVNVSLGKEAKVSLSAYPEKEFTGRIYYISSLADSSGKFPIKIQVDNRRGEIKAGVVAEVKIIIQEENNVLAIPKEAVFSQNGEEYIYVVSEDNRVKIKQIKTVPISSDKLKVLEGLETGEEIIIQGNLNLEEDQLVTPQNK